jgi:hypothetical protein
VTVCSDADEPGRKRARQHRVELESRGILQRVVEPIKGYKDVRDHLEAGHSLNELVVIRDEDQPEDDAEPEDESHDRLVAHELRTLRVRSEARRLFEIELRPPQPPFDAATLREVLARPAEPPDRISNLVKWCAGTLLTAQHKVGKTTFIGNLCRSLLTGDMFLDCFEVIPIDGEIAFLNYEMPAQLLASWLGAIGVPQDRLFLVNLRDRANPLATDEGRAALAALLRSRGTEAMIYDPFGRAFTGTNQNDPGEVGAWLADLDRFTRAEVGARDLFLPAHAGWNGERTRGASSIDGWADSIITLTSEEGRRYVRAIGRGIDLDEDQLSFDRRTFRLSLAGVGSRKEVREDRKTRALREAIIEIVKEKGPINGVGVGEELRDRGVPHQKDEHRPILRQLVKDHVVIEEPGKGLEKLYSISRTPLTPPDSPKTPPGVARKTPPTPPSGEGGLTGGGRGDESPQLYLVGGVEPDLETVAEFFENWTANLSPTIRALTIEEAEALLRGPLVDRS